MRPRGNPPRRYSPRSVTAGSTEAARRAGSHTAAAATVSTPSTASRSGVPRSGGGTVRPDPRAAALELMTAQELYYSLHDYTYADSPSRLEYQPDEGLEVEIIHAGRNGWAGRVEETSDTARSCVVVMGEVPQDVIARLGAQVVMGRPFCKG